MRSSVRSFLFLLLLPVLVQCQGVTGEPPVQRVSVAFGVAESKGVTESSVQSLDVFLFRADGTLDSWARANGGKVSVRVTANIPLTYWVVGNCPQSLSAGIRTEASLRNTLMQLGDNLVRCVMTGRGEDAFGADRSVAVKLDRLVAKVSIESITASFLDAGFAGQEAVLESVFLANAVGTCPYGGTPFAGTVWYNRMGYEASDVDALLYRRYDKPVSASEEILDCNLYCCPNPFSDVSVDVDSAPLWSPRCTRLVVQVRVGSDRYYYGIQLPAMQCNHHYLVRNLILLGPGSDHPDRNVVRNAVRFTVSVNPWIAEPDIPVDF